MNIIEYPHCKECSNYYRCKKKGYNKYKPKFLEKELCGEDCPYDFKCNFECIEYRQWCYEDLEFAKEMYQMYKDSISKCYKPSIVEDTFTFSFKEIKK